MIDKHKRMNNNLPQLPNDLIMKILRDRRDIRTREQMLLPKLNKWWLEWEEVYEDDIELAYMEGKVSADSWVYLTYREKKDLYIHHNKAVEIHESIICDGSLPDEYY